VRKRGYCCLVTLGIQDRLAAALAEVDLSLNAFGDLGAAGCIAFLESIPPLDVEINLHVERNEHRDRKIPPNDEIDLGFLSLAVPYCHAVITEKFWATLIRRRKLNEKYETLIGTDINDIMHL
jgi:hypothetical protein